MLSRTWKSRQQDRWNSWPLRQRVWTLNALIAISAISTGLAASAPVRFLSGVLVGLGGAITGWFASQRIRLHHRARGTRRR